ncbi:GNAT family N-acetyltransferase [Kribbella shirazensis]|uniref:Putative N-acetyltransferase YhbS n=1 Tax=Kribbella shirazensis TaxID=1105143 RepID=A0A7X6A2Y4_9ACTN|nr:N-acetyltransferase [Kribbella shirazensis]NIK59463.1 putative N-acetyltransferase YhbS [Kribbella shirazensis]
MSITWNTRVESPSDIEPLRDITRDAFGRQFEVDYLDALRADPVAWIPGLTFVATTADDEPIAYALLTHCHVGDVPVLSLGPVAVLPAYQRQGAGGAAVRAALAAAHERDEPAAVVLGHAEYYPRFGFRQATGFGIHHPEYDGPNLMALALGHHAIPAGDLTYPFTA